MEKRRKSGLLAVGILAALAAQASAGVFVQNDLNTDREINGDNTLGTDAGTARAGFSTFNSVHGRNVVFVFQLPTLAAGERVSAVDFQFTVVTLSGTPTFNGDLYGIGYGTSSTPPAAFYSGAADVNATKIVDNLVAPTGTVATPLHSNATALVDYLNSLYSGGAQAGNYVYLRISPDVAEVAASVGYNFGAAGGTSGAANSPPVLTVTTAPVPEAASVGLLMIGASALLLRRR